MPSGRKVFTGGTTAMSTAKGKIKAKGSFGKKEQGDVQVVDLGEAIERRIDRKVRAAIGSKEDGNVRSEIGSSARPPAYRPGGYRPGMFGGYRPWYAGAGNRFAERPFMGAGVIEKVKLGHMAGGLAVGVLGNRALVRVTPDIIKVDYAVVHDGIAFILGIIPVLAKPNSFTAGVALPGTIFLAGSLVDWTLNALKIKKGPSSIGSPEGGSPAASRPAGVEAGLAARQKLAALHSQMTPAGGAPARVVAQAQ
jgi:hypothetical protein